MFCSNCGKEVTGNYCSYCGTKIINNTEVSIKDNYSDVIIINGHSINIEEVANIYGSNKIAAIKHLTDITGAKLREAKDAVDKFYNNKQLKNKEKVVENITKNKEANIACCPKCSSTSLSANKKGFGIGKAVVGAWTFGAIGLTAGNIGAKKVRVTCLNCGNTFKI